VAASLSSRKVSFGRLLLLNERKVSDVVSRPAGERPLSFKLSSALLSRSGRAALQQRASQPAKLASGGSQAASLRNGLGRSCHANVFSAPSPVSSYSSSSSNSIWLLRKSS